MGKAYVDDTIKLVHVLLNWIMGSHSPKHDSSYDMLYAAEFEVNSIDLLMLPTKSRTMQATKWDIL